MLYDVNSAAVTLCLRYRFRVNSLTARKEIFDLLIFIKSVTWRNHGNLKRLRVVSGSLH